MKSKKLLSYLVITALVLEISSFGSRPLILPRPDPRGGGNATMLAPFLQLSQDSLRRSFQPSELAEKYGAPESTERSFSDLDQIIFRGQISRAMDLRLLRKRKRPLRALMIGGGKFQDVELNERYDQKIQAGLVEIHSFALENLVPLELRHKLQHPVTEGDIDKGLPFANGFFDIIMVGDFVMPYVQDKLAVLREIQRVLDPEGVGFVADFGMVKGEDIKGKKYAIEPGKTISRSIYRDYIPGIVFHNITLDKKTPIPRYGFKKSKPMQVGSLRVPRYESVYKISRLTYRARLFMQKGFHIWQETGRFIQRIFLTRRLREDESKVISNMLFNTAFPLLDDSLRPEEKVLESLLQQDMVSIEEALRISKSIKVFSGYLQHIAQERGPLGAEDPIRLQCRLVYDRRSQQAFVHLVVEDNQYGLSEAQVQYARNVYAAIDHTVRLPEGALVTPFARVVWQLKRLLFESKAWARIDSSSGTFGFTSKMYIPEFIVSSQQRSESPQNVTRVELFVPVFGVKDSARRKFLKRGIFLAAVTVGMVAGSWIYKLRMEENKRNAIAAGLQPFMIDTIIKFAEKSKRFTMEMKESLNPLLWPAYKGFWKTALPADKKDQAGVAAEIYQEHVSRVIQICEQHDSLLMITEERLLRIVAISIAGGDPRMELLYQKVENSPGQGQGGDLAPIVLATAGINRIKPANPLLPPVERIEKIPPVGRQPGLPNDKAQQSPQEKVLPQPRFDRVIISDEARVLRAI